MKCRDNCAEQDKFGKCPLNYDAGDGAQRCNLPPFWNETERSCDLHTPKPGRIDPGVIKFGDLVKIKLLELNGYITAICYRGEAVTYEVSYFSNGEYSQKWVEEFEIEEAK